MRLALPATFHPGEEEIPFDFLFGMGNISPDVFYPATLVSRWETWEESVHSISAVGGRGRRIDVDEVESTQRLNRRPRECVASDLMPCHFQMRFQPLWALTVEAVCVVIPFGVEGRWRLIVLSAVDILLYRRVESVSPRRAFSARWWADWGTLLHPR